MHVCCEFYHITHNNYKKRELNSQLMQLEQSWQSTVSTELVKSLYLFWGRAAVPFFN